MRSHAGKTAFFIKNTSKIIPKILLKAVQNTSKMEPKTVPKRSRTPSEKYVAPTSPKWPKRAPKMTSKWSLKSEKTALGALFFNSKKAQFSEAVFSLFLSLPGGPWTLKIKPKRCKGVQNRGSHFFTKNPDFIKKCAKNDLLWDPQKLTKPQKNHKKALPTTILKNTPNKPLKMNPPASDQARSGTPSPPNPPSILQYHLTLW